MITFLVEVFAVIIMNLYLVSYYAHPGDTSFGKSRLVKMFVIMSYSTNFLIVLSVPMDVFLSTHTSTGEPTAFNSSIDIFVKVLWTVLGFTIVTMIFIALPVMIVFYDSDPNLQVVSASSSID